jgi:hypothetical protein
VAIPPISARSSECTRLTFDAGFLPDHYLTFTNGTEFVGIPPASFWALSAHYADLTQGTAGSTAAVGMQLNAFGQEPGLSQGEVVDRSNNTWTSPTNFGAVPAAHEFAEDVIPGTTNVRNHRNFLNTIGLRMAINNSNIAGVTGSAPYTTPTTGNPESVLTGVEFSIPLSVLGDPTGSIKLAAFINGGGHDYASNQFAGLGILSGNLGGNGLGGFTGNLAGVNLNDLAGNQFVTIAIPQPVPEDVNGDGQVDVDDLIAVIGAWGVCPPPPAACPADVNQSGAVDVDDLIAVILAWGT